MKTESALLAKYEATKRELETTILKKLEAIQDRVKNHSYKTIGEHLQVLVMVSDELDDVLMNWEVGGISADSILDDLDLDEATTSLA
jgi:hypothetical protein